MTLRLGRLFERAEILPERAGPKTCCHLIEIFLLVSVDLRTPKGKYSLINKMQVSLITRFSHLLVQGSKTPE